MQHVQDAGGRRQVIEAIKDSFLGHLELGLGRDLASAGDADLYRALAASVRDLMARKWLDTQREYHRVNAKQVCYLSMEFLVGRAMVNALINLGVEEACATALAELGIPLPRLAALEEDAGLGNGGLGRLAACFLDSMATLGLPGYGYGIRYEYGIFRQQIVDGEQVEAPDNWLERGNPWEFPRYDCQYRVQYYGRVETTPDGGSRWLDTEDVLALAFDTPVPGYGNNTVNTMRLWSARSPSGFVLSSFNEGDYLGAVGGRVRSEDISRVLYPADHTEQGRSLRLKQEYFLACATLQDVIARFRRHGEDLRQLPEQVAIQLNDTHPVLAIVELLRILIDLEGFPFEEAWEVTRKVFSYTNHTVLPEALEEWPVWMLERILPRHMQLVCQLNDRFMAEALRLLPDLELARSLSLVSDGWEARVRMAHLAVLGSHAVNGVSALHSDIIRDRLFAGFARLYPERFSNKTNGITPRRWLLAANPPLANLLNETLGSDWAVDSTRLSGLSAFADDAAFRERWRSAKRSNKELLAALVAERCGEKVDPDSLFDCQVKRFHEYKRQLLNVLHVVTLYLRIKGGDDGDMVPRTFLFAGKAAPSYRIAKLIIRLINGVAAVVNADSAVAQRIKVVFVPNYSVSLAERIIPAADLSEQISTAGTEASGTGNMKFAINGALTIGTLDGANIEMCERIGRDNFFLFGHDAAGAAALLQGGYDPGEALKGLPLLAEALTLIGSGFFGGAPGEFQPLIDSLLVQGDRYLLLADFASYAEVQREVSRTWRAAGDWWRKSILNAGAMGWFNSDRAVSEYAAEIWGVAPVPVPQRKV